MTMMKRMLFLLACIAPAGSAYAHGTDSPEGPFGMPMHDEQVYMHAVFEQFEMRAGRGSTDLRWSGQAWAGTDSNRLWLKSEGIRRADGSLDDGKHEILYDRPISPYFDLQAGLRIDADSKPARNWAAFGIQGLAPYFFEVSATAYASDEGRLAANFEGSFDLLLTQRLILQPQLELNFYSKSDSARQTGSGLADIDTGLRLRYEISREFAPYVGIAYERKFGPTADFARASGERVEGVRATLGVRMWL